MTRERIAHAVRKLADSVTPGSVLVDPDLLETYRRDHALLCEAGMPCAVVLARCVDDVRAAVTLAAEYGLPVVPQGARSGLAGGANAIAECIVVSLERMDSIKDVDVVNRIAVVEPGVLNARLSAVAAQHGLFYPPDPSSSAFSTIGGNVATNAGGLCCIKYGVTRDYVLGLEAVLASGEVVRLGRRTAKGVAGLDLTSLFVGSEGTLGVITEVTLRLAVEPHTPRTVVATFTSTRAAAAAVSSITGSTRPCLLEFMDHTSLSALDQVYGMDFGEAAAMLIVQTDSEPAQAALEVATFASLLAEAGAVDVGVADDLREAEALMAGRKLVVSAFEKLGAVLIDDVCVPMDRLAMLVAGVNDIAAERGVQIGLVGHAGDGNFHPSVIFDDKKEAEVVRAWAAFNDVMTLALSLGGTITGEHGVGLLKRDMLLTESGPATADLQRRIKRAIDPNNLLNPGKVIRL